MSCLGYSLVWKSKFEQEGMTQFTSFFGSTFSYDYVIPTNEVLWLWLASIFSGIVLCVIVSKLSCSLLWCEFYVASRLDNVLIHSFLMRTLWLCIFKMKLLYEALYWIWYKMLECSWTGVAVVLHCFFYLLQWLPQSDLIRSNLQLFSFESKFSLMVLLFLKKSLMLY